MDITLRHAITYTTRGDVPVPVVAKSLLANERLIHEGLRILEACSPGVKISRVHVKVSELSNASPLREVLTIGLFLAYQESLEETVPEIIQQLTGIHVSDSADTIVTVLVFMVAAHLVDAAVERAFPGKSARKLKKQYEEQRDIVSKLINVDPATIDKYVQAKNLEEHPGVLQKALDFFLPARLEAGTTITTANGIVIPADAIAEIPSDMQIATAAPNRAYDLHGVVVDIHRADRDQNVHGWRAVVESVSDRKIRMELSPHINPADLYGKTSVIGDVTVMEERQENGDFSIRAYVVNSFRETA